MNQNFRRSYHQAICRKTLFIDKHGVPSNADKNSSFSILLAGQIVANIGIPVRTTYVPLHIAQERFELITSRYVENAFKSLNHLRPGRWLFYTGKSRARAEENRQFNDLGCALATNRKLRTMLAEHNIVKPDILIARVTVEDEEINRNQKIVDDTIATHTELRRKNSSTPIRHASISCNWTVHRGVSKGGRVETLNLIGHRKGRLPHIVAVTAEPLPMRIATLALGIGDLDCVYHFALPELRKAVEKVGGEDQMEMLLGMIDGRRLRDISDLPFDLVS